MTDHFLEEVVIKQKNTVNRILYYFSWVLIVIAGLAAMLAFNSITRGLAAGAGAQVLPSAALFLISGGIAVYVIVIDYLLFVVPRGERAAPERREKVVARIVFASVMVSFVMAGDGVFILLVAVVPALLVGHHEVGQAVFLAHYERRIDVIVLSVSRNVRPSVTLAVIAVAARYRSVNT